MAKTKTASEFSAIPVNKLTPVEAESELARLAAAIKRADKTYFEKDAPTPENFAGVIRSLLREALPAGLLDRVALHQDADTTVEVGRGTRAVHARIADGEERERLWSRQKELMPGFADYEKATDRAIPVVVLEPRPG